MKEKVAGKPGLEEERESVSKATVEEMQDDLPVGTEGSTAIIDLRTFLKVIFFFHIFKNRPPFDFLFGSLEDEILP